MNQAAPKWIAEDWTYNNGQNTEPVLIDTAAGMRVAVFDCDNNRNPPNPYTFTLEQARAHARLCSAAPDLLEALELILIYLGDWDSKDEECVKARAAIAKAKGKT